MTARKVHTVATLAAELRAELPTLTEQASHTLSRTLLREVARDLPSSHCVCPSVEITAADRNRVLTKARKLYL